jgi:predicted secreted hydrolase
VTPEKPVVLQGDRGLSAKGTGEGQASYYYSFTRLNTTGSVTVGDNRVSVTGLSWLDREWSTSLLGRTQVGWDWFSIQLEDETEIMHFRLRDSEGSAADYRDGVIIDKDGTKRKLDVQNIRLEELSTWRNERGDAVYPSKWRLSIPDENIDLELEPFLNDQELDLTIRYWEGAIRATGTRNATPITGTGYAELTGYTSN